MATRLGRVLSLNVGAVREFEYSRRPARVPSGNHSPPVRSSLEGDNQADRKAHVGPDKAIYAYAVEDARWLEQEVDRPFAHGEFGENLTTEGIEVNHAVVGERWESGTTVLEVSEPRIPCWRLGVRMNDPIFHAPSPRRCDLALMCESSSRGV